MGCALLEVFLICWMREILLQAKLLNRGFWEKRKFDSSRMLGRQRERMVVISNAKV